VFIPIFLDKGVPFLTGYFIFFYSPFVPLFFTALILYRKEGNAWNIPDFKSRMQLKPLKKADWFWMIGIFFGFLILLGLLTPLVNKIAQIPFFSPPDFFPAEINPNKTSIPGYAFGYKLSGEYWVILVYFAGWFFNIFGEEFLWRGIILPRQIKKYGSKAWIYHGVIWGLWHFFWKWQLILLLPFTLLFSYAIYQRKNTWVGIISHGALNLIPLIMIIIAVLK
jgi:membrane protease YdiL (CAAX protease family)